MVYPSSQAYPTSHHRSTVGSKYCKYIAPLHAHTGAGVLVVFKLLQSPTSDRSRDMCCSKQHPICDSVEQ